MRILVVSLGTYGDVLPFIGLAAEMRRRGHDVTLGGAERFRAASERAGVPFSTVMSDTQYAEVFEHPSFWRPVAGALRLFRAMPSFLAPVYDFIERENKSGDTLVVASHLALGARVAEDALAVPTASVHLTPIMLVSRHVGPRTPVVGAPRWLPAWLQWKLQTGVYTHFIAPLLLPGLNEFRASKGLPPLKKIRKWWHPRRRMLLMFPDWFAAEQPDWPRQVRQIDFPRADLFGAEQAALDPRLEAFLAAGDPPVAVTFGSARQSTDKLYRAAIEASRRLGRRCLVLSQQELPPSAEGDDRVFFSRYAPLSAVLPRCAALIHHGGVGTVALAFAAGTPQLVVPFAFDQFDHAARVARLGCGIWIRRSGFVAGRVARTLGRLLASKEVAESCLRVADVSAQGEDAIARACDELEAGFARRRSAGSRRGVVEPIDAAAAIRSPA
ncbi:glycosyltransferase family 1 protein [Chelatococcus sambhunathii]|uniref:Glycosyltransferase family 1 protein n=1 Tax=Chelatococcus sambhunathii TaxID=363953 RepID=A0ABU1DAZ1_9HYPH|nr:glycosyltransferase [Chelatococcus sambhunathii]MDR4305276.1 glycosyltransferase family 1 protein [Chelatococcus sambhunathii]